MRGNRINTRVSLLYIGNIILFKSDWYSLRRRAHHIRPPQEPFLWPHWGFTAHPKSLFHATEEAFPQRDNTLIMIHHDATHWYTAHFANLQNTGLFQPLRQDVSQRRFSATWRCAVFLLSYIISRIPIHSFQPPRNHHFHMPVRHHVHSTECRMSYSLHETRIPYVVKWRATKAVRLFFLQNIRL